MDIKKLIKIMNNSAILLEIKGENPFKSRAYSNAAEIIKSGVYDLEYLTHEGRLSEIKGFGDALVNKITEYYNAGSISFYEKLTSEVPESLVEITKISGLGPKRTKQLFDTFKISTLEELESACLDNKLTELKGFTPKFQEEILVGISHKKAARGRRHQQSARLDAEQLLNEINKLPSVEQARFAGSIRRACETISDFFLIVETMDESAFLNDYSTKIDNSKIDLPITIQTCKSEGFIPTLHEKTGSNEYINSFNKILNEKGIEITNGCFVQNGNPLAFNNEQELYEYLDLQYLPPELRESPDALDFAINHKVPQLVEPKDLRGMLHVHTVWSDGRNTIREMALAAKELGFEYIAICDHSRAAAYTGGLSIERVAEQHGEIENLNKEGLGIRILKGVESDILPDGSLDYPEEVLSSFDVVVTSIHSNFKMTRQEMTRRIIYALMSPFTHILGHPTGRLLLTRQPYELNITEIIDAAADYGKIIEFNANPYRLDLPWENIIYAKEKGVQIAINPDSHSTTTMSDVFSGLSVARKGFIEAKDVVNCLSCDDFLERIKGYQNR
ncbi:MAG: polymerase [Ignavibacteria bacterium]|nr:polymerase [Ignavibacteria bacterium]